MKTSRRREHVRLADLSVRILLPLWLALAALMVSAAVHFASVHHLGADAHAYWLAGRHNDLYQQGPMTANAYLYSPAFKQVIWPLAQLPWPAFLAVWMAAQAVVFAWLLRPIGWAWGVPAFLLCGFEIMNGNIMAFLAAALVIGMRRPVAWTLPLFTKVIITFGPLWYLVRRDWPALFRFAAAAALVVAISALIDPSAWREWLHFLANQRSANATLPYRAALGLVVVWWAARRDRPWLLAPAMVLVSPVLHGAVYLTMLAAIPRLRSGSMVTHASTPASQQASRARGGDYLESCSPA